jgi:hypothetical protein
LITWIIFDEEHNHEASHYAIFPTLLLLPPSGQSILLSSTFIFINKLKAVKNRSCENIVQKQHTWLTDLLKLVKFAWFLKNFHSYFYAKSYRNSVSHRQQFSNAFFTVSQLFFLMCVKCKHSQTTLVNYIQWKIQKLINNKENTSHNDIIPSPAVYVNIHHTKKVIQKNNWYAYGVGLLTDEHDICQKAFSLGLTY